MLPGSVVNGDGTIDNWLNPDAFEQPALGTYGNTTRGQFRGPSSWSVDMVLARMFRFAATQQIEVRVEAFNVLNWSRWNNPGTNLNATQTFGRITSGQDPRIMQFAFRFEF